MKSLLIIALVLVLCGAAFLTRPTQADFKQFITAEQTASDSGVKKIVDQLGADVYVKQCTFSDRLFWVDVQKDGKTVYTGMFNHWFNRQ